MKDPLEILSSIQKAEAPPFLLTRIRAKIAAIQANRITPRLAWTWSVSLLLVLAVNIAVIVSRTHEQEQENIAAAMRLLPDNSLYHE